MRTVIKVLKIISLMLLILLVVVIVKFLFWYIPYHRVMINPQTPIEKIYVFSRGKVNLDILDANNMTANYDLFGIKDFRGVCSSSLDYLCSTYTVNMLRDEKIIYIDDENFTSYIFEGSIKARPYYSVYFKDEKNIITLSSYEVVQTDEDEILDSDDLAGSVEKEVTFNEFNEFYEDQNNNSKYPLIDQIVRDIIEVVDVYKEEDN